MLFFYHNIPNGSGLTLFLGYVLLKLEDGALFLRLLTATAVTTARAATGKAVTA